MTSSTLATSRLGPLRHANFRWLLGGATINMFGGAFTSVAIAFAVLELGGSATQLGFVIATYALASVVTTLFGGVLGDRVSRKVMMEGSSAGLATVQAVVAVALLGGWATIPLITGASLVSGILAALAGPSSSAMTLLTVPADDLSSAIALRRLSANTANIIGFAAAGMIVSAASPGVAIAADAVANLVGAFCFSRLHLAPIAIKVEQSPLAFFVDGAREVGKHSWLMVLIATALVYHLFYGGAQGVLGPVVVGREYGAAAWGWSMSALMAGFVCGGIITLRWRPLHALRIGSIALSLTACFPAAIALSPNVTGILIGAFLHGLGLEIFSVWWDTSLQQNIPPEKLARVYAFDMVGSFAARPAGLAFTGVIAASVGEQQWLLVVAAVVLVGSLAALLVPAVRNLERR